MVNKIEYSHNRRSENWVLLRKITPKDIFPKFKVGTGFLKIQRSFL